MTASRKDSDPDSLSCLSASTSTAGTQGQGTGTSSDGSGQAAGLRESPFPKFGRFEPIRPLGGGGMGRVFEVLDPVTNQVFALKTWQREDPKLRGTLFNEFYAVSRIRHTNLVRLFDLFLDDPYPYFTMELIVGQDLLSWVRPKGDVGPAGFHEPRLRDAFRQLVDGLEFLHGKGKLHRDIKPSNVLVTTEGVVKLLDFGVTVALDDSGHYEPTVQGSAAGTNKYMSPAQAESLTQTSSDDWYSLGLMLFECLTGQFPFAVNNSVALHDAKRNAQEGVAPKSRQPAVPDDLDALCTALLRVDPARRPDATAILRQLGAESAPAARIGRFRLLGRTRELEFLQEALQAVQKSGQPRIVLVHGRSGIGKSELVNRFLDEAAANSQVRVFRGRCYENVFAPYQAFQELLTDVCRHLRKASDLERQAALPTDIQSLRDVFPVFGDQGVIPPLPRPDVTTTAQERRQQGFRALRELLMRIGPASLLQGPLPLLFIDDLQWGDLDSLALLMELFAGPAAAPCLFVGTYRDEDAKTSAFLQAIGDASVGNWSTLPQLLEIQPLALEDSAEFAGELLRETPHATPELCQLIARQSGGNPLFVNELAQAWRTRPDVRLAAGLNLEWLVQQRVAALPDDLRRLVQLVAVAGRPVFTRELFRAAEIVNQDQAWVQDLKHGYFLRAVGTADGLKLDTFHDSVRAAVLSSLAPVERRQLHERWLKALSPSESQAANSPASAAEPSADCNSSSPRNTEYEFIAQQLLGVDRRTEAAKFLRLEADQAAASFAFERAIDLYRRAIANHGQRDDVQRAMRAALAESLANTGHSAEAAGEFLVAAEDAPAELALDLRRRAAQRYLTSGHAPEGLAVLRQVLTKVGLSMPATRLGTVLSIAWWEMRLRLRGMRFSPRDPKSMTRLQQQRLDACWSAVIGLSLLDPVRAANYVARNLWFSLESGSPAHITRALAVYSGHAAINGPSSAPSVEKILDVARRAAKDAPGGYSVGAVALAEGIVAHLQGRWSAVIESCDKAEGLFRRCGLPDVTWEIDTAQTFAMWALMFRGDVTVMTRRQPRLLNQAIERNDRYARLNFGTVVMTYVNLAADLVPLARDLLGNDEALLMDDGFYVQHHNASLARAFLELYDGNSEAAWLAVKDGWPLHVRSLLGRIQKVRIDFFQAYGRAAVGALARDRKSTALRKAAQTAAARLRRECTVWSLAMADVIEAGALHCQQHRDQAAQMLRSAVRRLGEAEMQLFAATGRRQLALLAAKTKELQQVDDSILQAGVRNPARMAAALIPGFSEITI